jgi:hypothetical protein
VPLYGCVRFAPFFLPASLSTMMKGKMRLLSLFLVVLACGCASDNNPLMTGNPKDWIGHSTTDLANAIGQPTRTLAQAEGEIWEYTKEYDRDIPKGSHSAFSMGTFGGNNSFVSRAGFASNSNEEHVGHFVDTFRAEVRDGVIKKVYASEFVDGQRVYEVH